MHDQVGSAAYRVLAKYAPLPVKWGLVVLNVSAGLVVVQL